MLKALVLHFVAANVAVVLRLVVDGLENAALPIVLLESPSNARGDYMHDAQTQTKCKEKYIYGRKPRKLCNP